MVNKVEQGRKSRKDGKAFELRVRADLESKGWIVDRWSNNLECMKYDNEEGNFSGEIKIIPAKAKWAGTGRPMMLGAGFPDFICFRTLELENKDAIINQNVNLYEIIGVESKMTGKLDKLEKEKCSWLIDNHTFGKILIAEKTKPKNKIVIVYHDFEEKYGKI